MSTSPINVSSLLQAFGMSGGSSIDTNTIVSELMQVNSQPLTVLQQQVTTDQTNISAYGTILSTLSSLQSAVSALQNSTVGLSATPSDSAYFTASTTSGATAGTTAVDIKNLASAQSLYSGNFSSASSAVADLSVVNTQQLQIQVGSNTAVTINVTNGNNTLSGIANAINAANSGVTATVLKVSDGTYKLALTSNSTGSSNRITVKVDETGANNFDESSPGNTDSVGLSQLAFDPAYDGGSYDSSGVPSGGIENMTQTMAAIDATLNVNGIEIQRSSNTVTDAVNGVTLSLLKVDPNYNATAPNLSVSVAASSDSLASELNSLVTAYNTVNDTITTYYQPLQQGQQATVSGQGSLTGDNSLLSLSNTLRDLTTTSYGTEQTQTNNSLAYIGVTHDQNGNLQFDATKLRAVYQTDAANITTMINNMASSFGATISGFVNTTIPAEQNNYQSQVTSLQNQETNLQRQLDMEQAALTAEYSSLANLVTSNNSISQFITTETGLLTNPKSY